MKNLVELWYSIVDMIEETTMWPLGGAQALATWHAASRPQDGAAQHTELDRTCWPAYLYLLHIYFTSRQKHLFLFSLSVLRHQRNLSTRKCLYPYWQPLSADHPMRIAAVVYSVEDNVIFAPALQVSSYNALADCLLKPVFLQFWGVIESPGSTEDQAIG